MPVLRCRGHCNPLWAVFPPLQVVLSFACSVASLSRCPSHYLPGHHHLRGGDLADYPFGRGNPSTWLAARTALRDTPSVISGGNREFEVPNINLEQAPQNLCFSHRLDSLRGSSVKIGTIQRRLAWPLRKDDTHKSRSVNNSLHFRRAALAPRPPHNCLCGSRGLVHHCKNTRRKLA